MRLFHSSLNLRTIENGALEQKIMAQFFQKYQELIVIQGSNQLDQGRTPEELACVLDYIAGEEGIQVIIILYNTCTYVHVLV